MTIVPTSFRRLIPTLFFCLICVVPFPAWTGEPEGHGKVIHIKGSDTLIKALKEWTRIYQEKNPGARVEVSGGGSGNGIAALINGHVEIASSSRLLREREIQLLTRKRVGQVPIPHVVARDAVSVIVHPDNPINGLALHQLTDIYSKVRRTLTWGDFGVKVPECPDQKIMPINRKNNSGTYAFFKQTIFEKREHFDSQMLSMDASDSLVNMVGQMPCAIGYVGMAYVTNTVKTLCISKEQEVNAPCVPPTTASTVDQAYPLARSLYLYTLGEPRPEVMKFLDWVRGPEGQEILTRSGYIPPP
ncbi:MAG: phosphate ABC transporter substrate-binding protein [Magnetococcales bacterium]|nr:phosphate ABC transporter substrate-binding protein [Magnetococcales bacterium]MBF0262618.1 phosphate ABC transporter substrate-binding protein [Magnetococcales bacterium]MBF0262755.1 phosphate ABC transporter substrate-binding protein [Magnetococcales bacterium]